MTSTITCGTCGTCGTVFTHTRTTGPARRYWSEGCQPGRIADARRRFALHRAYLIDAKSGPCVDCGQRFPSECMDFDHRDGELKRRGVGQMTGWSSASLRVEVAKCDLVCANCHRIRTQRRRDAKRTAAA